MSTERSCMHEVNLNIDADLISMQNNLTRIPLGSIPSYICEILIF